MQLWVLVVLQVQRVYQIAFSEHYASMPDTITSIKHTKIFDPVVVDQTQEQTSSDDSGNVIANFPTNLRLSNCDSTVP